MNEYWIYYFLLIVGGYFFIMQMKLMIFPHFKGIIIGFEEYASCTSCRGKNNGKLSIPVKVKTDMGEILSAELSICTICLNRMNVGSRVGVTKVGSRYIGLPIMNLRGA